MESEWPVICSPQGRVRASCGWGKDRQIRSMKFECRLTWFHKGINAMQRPICPSALLPREFGVEGAFCDSATTANTVRPTSLTSVCP